MLLTAIHLVLQPREVKIARLNATYPKTRCAAIQQHHSASRQELCTFETCRPGQKMSIYRGRPEVTGRRSKRRD